MQAWVTELVTGIQENLQQQITRNHAETMKKHQSILTDHILIPGVVGDLEQHRTLKSYLIDREKTIKMQHD
jgi:hypothetical protein